MSSKVPIRIHRGSKVEVVDAAWWDDLRSRYARVAIDVGTGDGAFVYRRSGEDPACLCVGLEPVAETLREVAHRSARKPARGGRPNALFVVTAVEQHPGVFTAVADEVSVHFPWGSLLRACCGADAAVWQSVLGLAQPEAAFELSLNLAVFEDTGYAERLGLPALHPSEVGPHVALHLGAFGLEVESVAELADDNQLPATRWSRRLTRGSQRRSLRFRARFPAGRP